MIVLSVEGPDFIDKNTWATHKILGVFDNDDLAVSAIPADLDLVENIVLITDTDDGRCYRVEER